MQSAVNRRTLAEHLGVPSSGSQRTGLQQTEKWAEQAILQSSKNRSSHTGVRSLAWQGSWALAAWQGMAMGEALLQHSSTAGQHPVTCPNDSPLPARASITGSCVWERSDLNELKALLLPLCTSLHLASCLTPTGTAWTVWTSTSTQRIGARRAARSSDA